MDHIYKQIGKVINSVAFENEHMIKEDLTKEVDIIGDLAFDSIMLVQLVIELEDEFNMTIGDELIEPDLFYSIEKLANFINQKMQ